MVDSNLILLISVIITALIFDFINGFHDAANTISCIVSTRVLPPRYAVYWAAFFNLVATLSIGTPVAHTIGTGIINAYILDNILVLCALFGAITWNLITWRIGLPSSSSHALIGAFIGAATVKVDSNILLWKGIIKIISFIVISPLIGFCIAYVLMIIMLNLTKNISLPKANQTFRKMQLLSAAIHSFGHGINDAQKTMGVIAIALFTSGYIAVFHISLWIMILCNITIALGTIAGGWRIVKTMGTGITKLMPMGGFCAETAAAISLIGSSILGIPVSTTHTITGAILGVGSTRRLTAVRWGVAETIIWAWILTIPISALIAGIFYFITKFIITR